MKDDVMSGRIAYCVIQSNDLVASEDLKVNGLVCDRHRVESEEIEGEGAIA
ncbi:hypothetical protein [Spirulina major]|uniref:hypothetical protein n=1 Tax=Spirulina major TaxID=270636 RepID=UPI001587C925|nr:hypothetical protein [Spirulina major]